MTLKTLWKILKVESLPLVYAILEYDRRSAILIFAFASNAKLKTADLLSCSKVRKFIWRELTGSYVI